MLQVELLGSPRLLCSGREVGLPRKAVALIAILALEGRQPRSRLVEMLWGSGPEPRGQHNLRQTLYRIGAGPVGAHLAAGREQLELLHFDSDVGHFLAQCAAQNWPEALKVYKGEFLQGLDIEEETFREWLQHWRERLNRHWIAARETEAHRLEAEGKIRPALEVYLELIEHDGLQEHFHREAMRLYALLGQFEGALHQYRVLEQGLRRELGLGPLPETEALAEQIRQRTTVRRVPASASGSPNFNPPLVGRTAALAQLELGWPNQKILLIAGPAGVGKSRLAREWLSDKEPFVTLAGQPGDGPTPYASMTRWVRQAVNARPDLRLKSWIRLEASRLVPELWNHSPPPLDESTQVRFFTALVELLIAAHRSTTFLSEDEHFSDPWSLRALVVGLEQQGLSRLVITVRPEEVAPEVARRYQDWRSRQRAVWLELEPLNALEVAELIAHLSGRPARLFPERLYRATAGNPLFILQTLQSLFESGELRLGEGGVWETPYDESTHDYAELGVAASVRQTILERLERQPRPIRRCLEVAALLEGEFFASGLISEASALAEWEVSEALEQASQHRLLEHTPKGYRFTHDLLARVIADSLKPDRRRLIAGRLARLYARQAVHPARVAAYFEMAGAPEEAAPWWLQAARQAHALQAYPEADRLYQKALAHLPSQHPERFAALTQHFYLSRQIGQASPQAQLAQLAQMEQSARTPLEQAQLWFFRSMVLDDQSDLLGALEASRRAYALALEAAPAEAFYPLIFATHYQRDLGLLSQARQDGLAALELAQGLTPYHQIEAQIGHSLTLMLEEAPQEALAWVDQAERLMQQNTPAPSSFWLLQERIGMARAWVLLSLGRWAEALEHTQDLLQKAHQSGVQRQLLSALLLRAEARLRLGETTLATAELEQALALAEALNHRLSEVQQLYAELELAQHNPKAALRLSQKALHLAQSPVQQINALYSRAGAWLGLGQSAEARADLEQALALHGGLARFRCVSQQALRARLAVTLK
ncbi:MAG: BTAD domain-containing putative transcriptional regulator [Meiothermus sp.]|uniref:ATP-binding protein n=1 Tax=Meiothermus sp. TaxID=1955249 RepID=UPI00298EEFF1|nr:BTAD domain-containing putative transcriptional regulator [Meiothermus sp.]MDW8425769.1 BTAD domain-containing putative transcriptional regulator [Meiothermus sp.]